MIAWRSCCRYSVLSESIDLEKVCQPKDRELPRAEIWQSHNSKTLVAVSSWEDNEPQAFETYRRPASAIGTLVISE